MTKELTTVQASARGSEEQIQSLLVKVSTIELLLLKDNKRVVFSNLLLIQKKFRRKPLFYCSL